jgi:hypothetical protein
MEGEITINLGEFKACLMVSASIALTIKKENPRASELDILLSLKDRWNDDSNISQLLKGIQGYKLTK